MWSLSPMATDVIAPWMADTVGGLRWWVCLRRNQATWPRTAEMAWAVDRIRPEMMSRSASSGKR